MNQLVVKVLRTLRARRADRARAVRARTDELRKRISAKWHGEDSVTIIRAIREGR